MCSKDERRLRQVSRGTNCKELSFKLQKTNIESAELENEINDKQRCLKVKLRDGSRNNRCKHCNKSTLTSIEPFVWL